MRTPLAATLGTLLMLASACSPAPDPQTETSEPVLELRERQMELRETTGGLLLRTNAVDRAKVLTALGRAYAFEVDDETGDETALTLTLQDATLVDARTIVLAGTSHRLEYRAIGANSRLVRVVVGDLVDEEREADRSDDDSESDERRRRAKRRQGGSPRSGKVTSGDDKLDQATARATRRARERAERKAALLRELPALPPAQRAEALWQLDTDDSAHLDYLLGALRDEDPRVRAARYKLATRYW